METISNEVPQTNDDLKEKYLRDVLNCIICDDVMHPPVKMCINGHSVCKSCYQKITKCPLCRSSMIISHNMKVEAAYKALSIKCENHEEGCDFTSSEGDLEMHHKKCALQLRECPVNTCSVKWVGRGRNLPKHFAELHGNSSTQDANYFNGSAFWKIQINNLRHLIQYRRNKFYKYTSTFVLFGTLFRLVLYFQMQQNSYKVYIKRRLKSLTHYRIDDCRKYLFFLKFIDGSDQVLMCYSYDEVKDCHCGDGLVATLTCEQFQALCTGNDFIFQLWGKKLKF